MHRFMFLRGSLSFVTALVLFLCGAPAFGQDAVFEWDDIHDAPVVDDATAPVADATVNAVEEPARAVERPDPGNVRVMPRRLEDIDLPGFSARVNLRSLDPWDVVQLIEFLAHRGGLNNIVIGQGVQGMTTRLKFDNVTVAEALEVVLAVNRLAYEVRGGIITIMTDAEYQALYGVSFYDNKQVRIIELKYADAGRVANLLAPLKSQIGTIVSDPVTGTIILVDTPDKIAEMRAIAHRADIETVARVIPTESKAFILQYADVDTVGPEVNALLTPEVGTLRMDGRTKTLVVTDLPHQMRRIEELLSLFDRRPRSVFIEAKIVEVSLSDEFRLGVNWEHVFNSLDPRMQITTSLLDPLAIPGSEASSTMRLKTIVGGGELNAIVNALDTVGNTRILSNPHIAVIDGNEATIKVQTRQPYAEALLETGSTNVIGENIQFIDVGVKLDVVPRISDDGMISMSIRPEVSSISGFYQATRQVPIVKESYAETKVMVRDGQTLIIAGMIQERRDESESHVPMLGRIPLLGAFFRHYRDSRDTQETITFLTPRIISGEEPVALLRDIEKAPKPMRQVTGPDEKDIKSIR